MQNVTDISNQAMQGQASLEHLGPGEPAATSSWADQLQQSLYESFTSIWEGIVTLVPNLIVATIIFLIGYAISAALRWLAVLVLRRLHIDGLFEKTGLTAMSTSIGLSSAPSRMLGQLIFYGSMLMFTTISVDLLGLDNLSQAVHTFIAYLPNVVAAMVILVAGLIFANFIRDAVTAAAERVGVEYGSALGGVVFAALLIVIGTMVVGQLQLETALVNRTIEIVLLAGGAAVAIALGFGTRDAAKQIVAGLYAREAFQPGATLTIGDFEGEVVAVEKVNTKLKSTDGGILVIPNAELIETQVKMQA